MEKLVEAARHPDYPAEIVGVISNKQDAAGLKFAKAQGISTAVISLNDFANKAATDAAINEVLEQWQVQIVCLAGFMRLLGAEFCEKWQGQMINIHPSLLPDFKGLNTHSRALEAEVSQHGCTVHFVTADMDDGPVIGQVAVPVLYDDTQSMLADRVLAAEHKLYPWALAQVALGEIKFPDAQ